jgi:hypothetical protein
MLRISQNPLLFILKKVLLPWKYDEKHACCHNIKATSPMWRMMKTGM